MVTTKQELIAYTTTEWQTFVTYVDRLPAAQWTGPRDAAGWSVQDHVAHVTRWDQAVIAALREGTPMQQYLGISETAWTADSLDPMNEEIRGRAFGATVDQVQAERDATWRVLVTVMAELDVEQLSRSGGEAGLAVGTALLTDPVLAVLKSYWGDHYAEHLADIKVIVGDHAASSPQ